MTNRTTPLASPARGWAEPSTAMAASAQTLAAALQPLLTDTKLQERCRRVGEQLQQEDGVARACEAIERFAAGH